MNRSKRPKDLNVRSLPQAQWEREWWDGKLGGQALEEARAKPLDDYVLQRIAFLASADPECDDWLVFKKRLMLEVAPEWRQLFSTRDPRTKKHHPFNTFEKAVRNEWLRLTGKTLMMPPERMLLGPEAYV